MRIVSVKLNGQYKGLRDQAFDFSCIDSNIQAFIGLNGAGKSQLLELIAEIFAYVERWQRQDFITNTGFNFGVEVVYQIQLLSPDARQTLFKIVIKPEKEPEPYTYQDDVGWFPWGNEIPVPDHIVGYSSGLNANLQGGFLKNMVQYFDVQRIKLKRQKELSFKNTDDKQYYEINQRYVEKYPHLFEKDSYGEIRESPSGISSLIFLDYDSARLMISSLGMLSKEDLDDVFPECKFKYPSKIVFAYALINDQVEADTVSDIKMLRRVAGEANYLGIGKQSTELQYEMFELDNMSGEITLDLNDPSVRARLYEANYGNPFLFFKRLFKAQQLGIKKWRADDVRGLRRDNYFGNVKKPLKSKLPITIKELLLSDGKFATVNYDDLSDGEAQLIEIMGMARLFSSDNTLYLLDEPETHLNPAWRTYFHKHLSKALKPEFELNTQVLLSTHSPFMISSLRKNNVFMFERGQNDRIEMMPIGEQTYGTTFEILIKRHFGLKSTISQSAVAEVKQYLNSDKLVDKETDRRELTKAREWIETNLGESMEKAYLLGKLQR
ncbi:AAA family ATPase [Rheinheimera sp. UJ63]|uniref:AAA family ATPase n=1 Tax=Rheinheimera sp. UJ63 TaxID=2910157 RepID=UPI001F42B09C|nr:AAA family ATPase [Rheinheimera sp. UJ63]MCF4009993.1 AAA family ATPase [Rheinheimera sp. UJ63]